MYATVPYAWTTYASPGVLTAAAALAPDLLAALIAYLRSAPTVVAAFAPGYGAGGYGQLGYGGAVQVYDAEADAGAWPPFLVVDGYREVLPGETADDGTATGTVVIVTSSLDEARAAARAVKAALDPINVNPRSLARDPLVWETGTETVALREDSSPRRLPGIGKGGRYVWVEEIDYTFWVSPSV